MKFLQNLGKSLMLPIAVMPVAAILMGIGNWLLNTAGQSVFSTFFLKAGGAVIDNLALLFAVGVAIGMAKKSDGTSALAGLVSWLVVTVLLAPETVAGLMGLDLAADPEAIDSVDPAFGRIQNAFTGIICGLIGAYSYNRFKDVKLPDWLGFFSGKRAVAIVSAGLSLALAAVLFFLWPLVFGGLTSFGEWMVGLGPLGAGLYGMFNRLLIPLGLHHALNSVFWFDVAGINDLSNFLNGTGTYGVTGQYMSGFFPIMMFGLPGAALAMYVTAKSSRKKLAAGILLSAAVASFFVGITEPLEFSFMFLAPALYVIHAFFTGVSLFIAALLPTRMGFGFSAGAIDLGLGWNNPMAQNPWILLLMGLAWFVVYFLVFVFVIQRWQLATIGREDDDVSGVAPEAVGDSRYTQQASLFIAALGGKENITSLDNCATRLRMEIEDVSLVDEPALKRAGAAGTMKTGGHSVQVIYGTTVQFVKDAMEAVMAGAPVPAAVPTDAAPVVAEQPAVAGASVVRVRQPMAGKIVPLSEVPDATFAQGMMGPGLAIDPSGGLVSAPAAATVKMVFPTGHAIGLVLADGTELLIHVGLDTVKMKGEGFETLVKKGDRVEAGAPLLRVDLDAVRAAGYSTVTPVVVLNNKSATLSFE